MLTSKKSPKSKKARHAEYYDMTPSMDALYEDSKNGKVFTNLMGTISCRENIMLAFRNIKRNGGSITPGIDKQTIKDIEEWPAEVLVKRVQNKLAWYKPKPVKRVEIPKHNGKLRPLGIPAIIDRLVQQCILQILEPICEAKFYDHSYGFRPVRSQENAIARCNNLINTSKMHFVVDIDIEGFFDNVDHCKLCRQLWTMGIRDKQLLCIIREMLKAPIKFPDGTVLNPTKGTPQGGLLSPLLSNVVLNELDWWIASQWELLPTQTHFNERFNKNGSVVRTNKYRALKSTRLKEMFIVRYADDFKIFCRKRCDADNAFVATQKWLKERLKLSISKEKSKVVNLKRTASEFLGYEFKTIKRAGKNVVSSHMTSKALEREVSKLKGQIDKFDTPKNAKDLYLMISLYNSMVIGIQNYYCHATHIASDARKMQWSVEQKLKSVLGAKYQKKGNPTHGYLAGRYGRSRMVRYCDGHFIAPIGYVQYKTALSKKRAKCMYTAEGRDSIHKPLGIDVSVLLQLMRMPIFDRSIEYFDNRLSLYCAQYGKCAVTGLDLGVDEIHCHHKTPRQYGGTDKYQNLVIVHRNIHVLIHASDPNTIKEYMSKLSLTKPMLTKLNKMRTQAQMDEISTQLFSSK